MAVGNNSVGRRSLLALTGGGMLAAAVSAHLAFPDTAAAGRRFHDEPFTLGVASGDPRPDGVVLWTRLAPDPTAEDGNGGMPPWWTIPVLWQVAEDPRFRRVVRAGVARATPALAHSVHVEVSGLRPDRVYWYRFRTGPYLSSVGRTRTAPDPSAALSGMALAFASCQNLPGGYFTALRHMASDDLDLVVHLGDYIYEGSAQGDIGRGHLPNAEVFSLEDYRIRYGQYKEDKDLQAAHAAHPWVVTVDDHDVENNWAGSHSQPDDEPDQDPEVFLRRRAAAFQAFYENTPLRLTAKPDGPDIQLYRRLDFGQLARISMIDARQYRDPQLQDQSKRYDPDRTMLGEEQERWVLDSFGGSPATWNIMGNQIFAMQADHTAGPGERYGMDTWDGYAAARQRLFDGIRDRGVENFVILTGDAHRSVAADLKINFDEPSSDTIGTEFLGTSLSSGGDGEAMDRLGEIWLAENPHMRFHNAQRGYTRCEITPDSWEADYRVVPYVSRPDAPIESVARVYVQAGEPGIAQVEQ